MEPRLTCIACGAPIVCEPDGDCWCKREPMKLPMPGRGAPAGCYCQACLRAKVAAAEAEATKA